MSLENSLFAVTFSDDFTPEQHPRGYKGRFTQANEKPGAVSHFARITDGPPDLHQMLQEINDPVSRAAAADRMLDLGRDQEAEMLRDPKHPLLTIGGGVFYAPGSRIVAEAITRQENLLGRHPRLAAALVGFRGEVGTVVTLSADGHTVNYGTHGRGTPSSFHNRNVANRGKAGPAAVSLALAIQGHQTFADREHLAATPAQYRETLEHLGQHSAATSLDPGARLLAGSHYGASQSGGRLTKPHHELSVSVRRKEHDRRRKAGLRFHRDQRVNDEIVIPHHLTDLGLIPEIQRGGPHQGTPTGHWLAPSRRHLDYLLEHGNGPKEAS